MNAAFLIIDAQDRWLNNLHPQRKANLLSSFVEASNMFAEIGVPTILVVYGKTRHDHRFIPAPENPNDLFKHYYRAKNEFGMPSELIRVPHLGLYVKGNDNGFKSPVTGDPIGGLKEVLLSFGFDTTIHAGLNTANCLLNTAVGAVESGFGSYIAYGLWADTAAERPMYLDHPHFAPHATRIGLNNSWHRELLAQHMPAAFADHVHIETLSRMRSLLSRNPETTMAQSAAP